MKKMVDITSDKTPQVDQIPNDNEIPLSYISTGKYVTEMKKLSTIHFHTMAIDIINENGEICKTSLSILLLCKIVYFLKIIKIEIISANMKMNNYIFTHFTNSTHMSSNSTTFIKMT